MSPRFEVRTVHTAGASGERPPAVFVDMCHFDGGQTAILASGPGRSRPARLHDRPGPALDLVRQPALELAGARRASTFSLELDGRTPTRLSVRRQPGPRLGRRLRGRPGRPVARDPGDDRQPRETSSGAAGPTFTPGSGSFKPARAAPSARSRSSISHAGRKLRPIAASPARGWWRPRSGTPPIRRRRSRPRPTTRPASSSLNQAVVQGSDAGHARARSGRSSTTHEYRHCVLGMQNAAALRGLAAPH